MKRLLLIPLAFAGLFLLPAAANASSGYIYQALLKDAKKSCKCKNPANKASKDLKKLMAGKKGLYGFKLTENMLPQKAGLVLWSKRLPAARGAGSTDFVLYSSKSHPTNKRVAVSGTVSLPKGKAPPGGWPLITWAHGTVGLADSCAPSQGEDGSYGGAEPLIEHWLEKGYAVAATDYEGLGTPGVHPYLYGPSAARSVLDIALAAGKMGTVNTKDVFIAGHSQGAHAALFAGSLARQIKAIGHKGTVVYAPPSKLETQAQLISTQPADAFGISALAASILRGAVVASPNIKPKSILQPEALKLYSRADKVCLDALGKEFAAAGLSPSKLLLPGWDKTADGMRFIKSLKASNPALPLQGETLLLQGLQDTTVLPMFTDVLFGELNALNPGRVEYLRFSNKDTSPADGAPDDGADYLVPEASSHSGVLSDSLDVVDSWIAAR